MPCQYRKYQYGKSKRRALCLDCRRLTLPDFPAFQNRRLSALNRQMVISAVVPPPSQPSAPRSRPLAWNSSLKMELVLASAFASRGDADADPFRSHRSCRSWIGGHSHANIRRGPQLVSGQHRPRNIRSGLSLRTTLCWPDLPGRRPRDSEMVLSTGTFAKPDSPRNFTAAPPDAIGCNRVGMGEKTRPKPRPSLKAQRSRQAAISPPLRPSRRAKLH